MDMLSAWDRVEHGGAVKRSSTGLTVQKWMSDKLGLSSSLVRWLKHNIDSVEIEDIFASDWVEDNTKVK